MIHLDKIDRRLLYSLDENSRIPLTLLARRARTSRAVAEYRVKKLLKEGVIVSLSALVDPAPLGFTSWKIYVQFNNKNPTVKKMIVEYACAQPAVWWVIETEGRFDLMFSLLTRTVHELYASLHEFQTMYGVHTSKIEITSHILGAFCSRGYLVDFPSRVLYTVLDEPKDRHIDATDLVILSVLTKNSRESVVSIAKKAKTTPRIVHYRIQELLRKKILANFRMIPDVNILGMDYYKVLVRLYNLTEARENAFCHFLEESKLIINYTRAWGPWDIEFEAEVENYKGLIKILNSIRELFSDIVQAMDQLLITKEHKQTNDFLTYTTSKL